MLGAAFSVLAGIIKLASAWASYIHDKREQQVGALSQSTKSQAITIKALNAALNVDHVVSKEDLAKKLQDGTL